MDRILHVLSQIPGKTGSGVFFENIVSELSTLGFPQAALLGLPKSHSGYTREGLSRVEEVLFETSECPYLIPGMSDIMPYESTRFSSLSGLEFEAYKSAFKLRLHILLEEFKPDFIITHHLWLVTAFTLECVAELSAGEKKPKVFTVCHGTDLRQLELAPRYKNYVTSACAALDGIFALHPPQKNKILGNYPIDEERIRVIGVGFNGKLFYLPTVLPTPSQDIPEGATFIFAGKLSDAKGVPELLRAFPEEGLLYLAGSGSGEEYENIIQDLEGRNNVKLLGMIPQPLLAEYFRKSDVLILPSYYEGLPLVLLEALASGLRLIVNDLPGVREWLPASVVNSGDVIFLTMPALASVDRIASDAKSEYIKKLELAIREMASRVKSFSRPHQGSPADYYEDIRAYSWSSILEEILKSFEK